MGSDEPVRSFKAHEPQGPSMDQHLPILSLEPEAGLKSPPATSIRHL
ncbi:MAG: hypothetical protein KIH01_06135 [Candidatus Freyarchaeota archaeon]|nr:hypothetical protein [Candidatus Jordarchaeia archaeon]